MRRQRPLPSFPEGPVATDYCIAEVRAEPAAPSLVTLYLDGTQSSCLDLADPSHLEFEYMQHMALVLDAVFGEGTALRVMHLGGAGCAFPRALDAVRPGSRQLAVEIDAKLASLVREWFALPPSPRLRIRAADAREALETTKASWNAVVRDAFVQGRIPQPLLTLECARRAREVLGAEGVYLGNAVLSPGEDTLAPDVAAIGQAFEHVLAIADPAVLARKRLGNVVLAASAREFPLDEIDRRTRRLPLRAVLVREGELRARARSARPLTDPPSEESDQSGR